MIIETKMLNQQEQDELINKIKNIKDDIEIYPSFNQYLIINNDNDYLRNELNKLTEIKNIIPTNAWQAFTSKNFKEKTSIAINNQEFFKDELDIIAGPCSVESYEQMAEIATNLKANNIKILRGGIVKPRTSPYSFQGYADDALAILVKIKKEFDLLLCCEIMSISQLEKYQNDLDIIQIGTRNMQNFELLKAVGQLNKPVILKRGFSATIKELLLAAEYIMNEGNLNVILCERGIRSFENSYRNILDLNAVVYLKNITHLPVIVDPSHACGHAWMVADLSKASIAAAAEGLMIEVHNNPSFALSDGEQSLDLKTFTKLNKQLIKLHQCLSEE